MIKFIQKSLRKSLGIKASASRPAEAVEEPDLESSSQREQGGDPCTPESNVESGNGHAKDAHDVAECHATPDVRASTASGCS